jgi:RNA ligase (TIGR02306 family)
MKEKDPNFKVNLTTIREINPHPNPDVHSLLLAKVYDFDVIISNKSGFKVGDKVVYFPVNSILPFTIENFLFPPDSKIKLDKSRIKAIKIQKFVSQGLISPWDSIKELYSLTDLPLETDLQEKINVKKHNPHQPISVSGGPNNQPTKKEKFHENKHFHSYNGCTNLKWEPYAFSEDDEVYITEKIHGSNFRCGWVPYKPKTFWEKIKTFFKMSPKHEFCYGSNNVQRQRRQNSPTWYKEDIYGEMVYTHDLKDKCKEKLGYIIYGEIYGPSVQKGYHYGLKDSMRRLVVFDILHQTENESRWLSLDEVLDFCKEYNLNYVPVLYRGKWNKDIAVKLATGDSVFCPSQKTIEGVVAKHSNVFTTNRKKIKIINPDYLIKEASGETSDFQ